MVTEQLQSFDMYETPADLLMAHDPDFRAGHVKLHGWQLKWMFDFAKHSDDKEPFKGLLRAANGSGKDKFAISPCVLWLGMRYQRANSIITSSSGRQLDRQTDTYVNDLAKQINADHGFEVWKCNYREYSSRVTGGMIDLFATDEPGKAEGTHPIAANGQMGIFVSEAKSIPNDIFKALARCNGFTKWCEVSSPGLPDGHFFDKCQDADIVFPPNNNVGLTTTSRGWRQYHVTAYDCPHLSSGYIEEIIHEYGAGSHLVKSMIEAEFGVDSEAMVVISIDKINRVIKFEPEHIRAPFNTGGVDLSAGGDETCLAVRNGNKLIALVPFRYTDTQKTVDRLESEFRKWHLETIDSPIFTDAGGLGKPIIDQLRARGWKNVRYVFNQQRAFDDKAYRNLGTNLWFKFARLLEEMEVCLIKDDLAIKQLANRFYKITEVNKFQLESKIQARARGHPSPDRADSIILAFYDYSPAYSSRANSSQITIPRRGLLLKEPAPFSQIENVKGPNVNNLLLQYGYGRRNDNWLNTELSRVNSGIKRQLSLKN